ncbi:hypothetical protein IscW_ISCW015362, partial [Ixodes scapularis]
KKEHQGSGVTRVSGTWGGSPPLSPPPPLSVLVTRRDAHLSAAPGEIGPLAPPPPPFPLPTPCDATAP